MVFRRVILHALWVAFLLTGSALAEAQETPAPGQGPAAVSSGVAARDSYPREEQTDRVTWPYLAEHLAQHGRSLLPLNLSDCPEDIRQREPARVVAQYIENTFYLWAEYDIAVGEERRMCVVMDRPEPGPLTAAQAQVLLTGSGLWMQTMPPAEPGVRRSAGTIRAQGLAAGGDRLRITNTQVSPWNSYCALESHFAVDPSHTRRGTGCLVGPYMVLTSARNIYDLELASSVTRVTVTPGQRQHSTGGAVDKPYGTRGIAAFCIAPGYPAVAPGAVSPEDYGAVFLEQSFFGINTYMPLEFAGRLSAGDTIRMAGYAEEGQGAAATDDDNRSLGDVSGILVAAAHPDSLFYAMVASAGDSGSPLRRGESSSWDSGRIVGIHSGFSTSQSLNGGPRLSSHKVALITRWMRWQPKAMLPADLVGVDKAPYAATGDLAPGSQEAQESQKRTVQQSGLPLEVETLRTGIVLRLVPAGTFIMGSPASEAHYSADEGPPHAVTLTRPFYCGKFEVTQGQWQLVLGCNPSYFQHAGPEAPVERVSWDDAQIFVKALCDREGVPEGTYRLLTEAEWEYACRAGSTGTYYSDSSVLELERSAWHKGNSGASVHPVGQKRPNAFGLYDMHGNVYEWCQDWLGDYPSSHTTDPAGPATGISRVFRGGSWAHEAWYGRSANRNADAPRLSFVDVGLRIARAASGGGRTSSLLAFAELP